MIVSSQGVQEKLTVSSLKGYKTVISGCSNRVREVLKVGTVPNITINYGATPELEARITALENEEHLIFSTLQELP